MRKLRELYQFYAENPDKLDEVADQVLSVEESRLAECLATQASDYFYWSNLHSVAKYEVEKQEHHVSTVLIDCRMTAREHIEKEKKLRPTKDAVEEQALAEPVYQRAVEQLIKIKYLASRFAELRSAIYQRGDMLQSLNARHCKELNFYGDQDELAQKLDRRAKSAKAHQDKTRI